MKKMIEVLTGFLMACADSVPGVSGGSICYIMGQYEKLFSALLNIKNYKEPSFKTNLFFLIRIMLGWITGLVFAILIISKIIDIAIYELSSLFIGFIFVAICITFFNEKQHFLENKKDILFAIIGFVVVTLITYLGAFLSISIENMSPFMAHIYLFVTGFIAISAMLLPGISGSTMLIIFGSYYFVIDALEKFLSFDFSMISYLFLFGFGVLFGGFFAIKVIDHQIKKNYSKVLYLIEGLMIGSLYPIIMGPSTIVDENDVLLGNDILNFSNFSWLAFILGILFLLLLNYYGQKNKSEA